MAIVSQYVREGLLYTDSELKALFQFDEDQEEFDAFKNKLKKYQILKVKRFKSGFEDASLIDDDDDDYIEDNSNSVDCKYLFRFVGIVYANNRIVNVYPKYIDRFDAKSLSEDNKKELHEDLKQVVRVLKKFNQEPNVRNITIDRVNRFNDVDNQVNKRISILSIIFFLLDDYYIHGLYSSEEEQIEINGEGGILWQQTVDELFPIIENGQPYYVETYTRKKEEDDYELSPLEADFAGQDHMMEKRILSLRFRIKWRRTS